MNVAGIDGIGNGYGYALEGGSSQAFVSSKTNFGILPTSTVKIAGLNVKTYTITAGNDATFASTLAGKPDIVVMGYDFTWTSADITAAVNYLNNKGVMIICDENYGLGTLGTLTPLFRTIYANALINVTNYNAYATPGGTDFAAPFTLASIPGDPVLTGPFQPSGSTTLAGLQWGSDATPCAMATGLPSNVIVYSTGYTSATASGAVMIRDPNLNLFWVGDGGFLSSGSTSGVYASTTICPFAVNASGAPIPRTGWDNASTTVYNSYIFGKVLAWAINQAQYSGINQH